MQNPLTAITRGPRYFRLGLALLALPALQQIAGLRWGMLETWQADDLYKQISGFVLLGFIAHQWYFPLLRVQGAMPKAARNAGRHRRLGAWAPLFYVFHTQQTGFAYLMALSLVFFAVFLSGLCNPETTRIRGEWFRPVWVTAHVGMATLLPFIIVFHVFVTYWFE